MTSVSTEVNQWYESLRNQRLAENEQSSGIWNKYKSDLEVAKSMLSMLPKKVSHKVMVPIGSRALMPGRIVHTNEFLVNLGETWFAKRTASQTQEICDRRIKKCGEMLDKLKKERELIVNKSHLPGEEEAFGSEERPEIIEYVTEEENELWKKQHRIKEREYRQKLAQLRAQEKKQIETEEDLWKHLDELELQEELEDELNRLNEERGSSNYDSNDDDEDDGGGEEDNGATDETSKSDTKSIKAEIKDEKPVQAKLVESQSNTKHDTSLLDQTQLKKRKVSFACDLDPNNTNDSDDEPLRLQVNFSNVEPPMGDSNSSIIQSPSDIYNTFIKSVHQSATPVPVLKSKINPNKEKELEKFEREKLSDTSNSESDDGDDDDDDDSGEKVTSKNANLVSFSNLQFKDIVERNPFTLSNSQKTEGKPQKVSRFKASRMKIT